MMSSSDIKVDDKCGEYTHQIRMKPRCESAGTWMSAGMWM